MNRYRIASLFLALASLACISCNAAEESTRPPNIVFIFSDDQGWGDMGVMGHPQLKTPRLDRLASEGTMLTSFYVSGSVCSPSRAAIMTGRFPARDGVHGHFATAKKNAERKMPDHLDPSLVTVVDLLREGGYRTGHYGKWHLGSRHLEDMPQPGEYGFDEYRIGTLIGDDPFDIYSPEVRPVGTKKILDEAMAFIERNKDQPFFVNAWLFDPHATLNPSEEQIEPYARLAPGDVQDRGALQVYYGTVTEMDRQIGIFLDRLDELGLAENTIVIFTSDNGPEDMHIANASHSGIGSAGPFRGRKRSIYEGGIRVPFIVRWPGQAPEGRVDNDSVFAGVDFLPTLCDLAGVSLEDRDLDIDGENLAPIFRGQSIERSRPLLWEWRWKIWSDPHHRSPILAIRDGKWKLLLNPDRSRVELYDIVADPAESNNLSGFYPDVVKRLSDIALEWQAELPEGPMHETAGSNTWPWPKGK